MTTDNYGRIIVVECKVMRVVIFDMVGNVLNKFSCSRFLEFPNGVVVNDSMEIFISDNRAHCVKVFDYQGNYLCQIGGEGVSNFPIGVGLTSHNISLLSGLASLITPLVARPLAASRGRIWASIHFLGCGQPSESGPKIWSGL